MVSITYRITIPREVIKKFEELGIKPNKNTITEMAELYFKIKTNVSAKSIDEVIRVWSDLVKKNVLEKAYVLSKKLTKPPSKIVSPSDVIEMGVNTVEFLKNRGLLDIPEMLNEFEDFTKVVEEIVKESEEYKSLPTEEKNFIISSLPYFAFHTLILIIFKEWIKKNPEKVVEIFKDVFFNKTPINSIVDKINP